MINSVSIVNKCEKLDMVYENDVNSMGLWLLKKGYMKGNKTLMCNWIALGVTSTLMQLYFAGQLIARFVIMFNFNPIGLFGDEETAK